MDSEEQKVDNKVILIAEDEEISRIFLRCVLRKKGYRIHEAADGMEAVEVAESRAFDTILMDISMPRKNGIDAANEIRSGKLNRHTPIIAVTAYPAYGQDSGMNMDAFSRVIIKPVDEDELLDTLVHFQGN